jgi:cystine transport system substrate-binding protein
MVIHFSHATEIKLRYNFVSKYNEVLGNMSKKVIAALVAVVVVIAAIFGFMSMSGSKSEKDTSNLGLIEKGTLTVGLEGTYAPYSYRTKDGKLTGIDVDVAKAVAKEMGLKVKFVPTKWDSLIAGLQQNKYDIVFNDMAISKARMKVFRYASEYIYTGGVVITKADSGIKSVTDIKGKKTAQSAVGNYVKYAEKLGATNVAVPGFAEAVATVQNGQADATLNDAAAWAAYQDEHPDTDLIAIKSPAKYMPVTGAAPIMNKKSEALDKAVTEAEAKLRKAGEFKKISERYLGSDYSENPEK